MKGKGLAWNNFYLCWPKNLNIKASKRQLVKLISLRLLITVQRWTPAWEALYHQTHDEFLPSYTPLLLSMNFNLISVVEENLQNFLLHMGRAINAEEYDSEKIHWIIPCSPVSYYNAVFRTNLHPGEDLSEIDRFIERLQHWKVPGHWFITPSVHPPEFETELIQRGFVLVEEEPQLVYELAQAGLLVPQRLDLQIWPVRTQTDLEAYADVLAHGFEDSSWVYNVFKGFGLGENNPFQHYIGWLEDKPVATASLLHCGETAGIYYVCVHSGYRHQGFGTTILTSTLQDAQRRKYKRVVLGATTQGYNLYLRLGFQDVCTFKFYEFKNTSDLYSS